MDVFLLVCTSCLKQYSPLVTFCLNCLHPYLTLENNYALISDCDMIICVSLGPLFFCNSAESAWIRKVVDQGSRLVRWYLFFFLLKQIMDLCLLPHWTVWTKMEATVIAGFLANAVILCLGLSKKGIDWTIPVIGCGLSNVRREH